MQTKQTVEDRMILLGSHQYKFTIIVLDYPVQLTFIQNTMRLVNLFYYYHAPDR